MSYQATPAEFVPRELRHMAVDLSGHDKKKAAGAAAFVAYHPRL